MYNYVIFKNVCPVWGFRHWSYYMYFEILFEKAKCSVIIVISAILSIINQIVTKVSSQENL